MNCIALQGCRPQPFAHYLKALGVWYTFTQQVDPDCRGFWKEDVFHLETTHSKEDLVDFFLHTYSPTPIVTPWNGGSGFYKKDNQAALLSILSSSSERWRLYRDVIAQAQAILERMGLDKKPEAKDKETLLSACRSQFPDEALSWLDAVFLLTEDGVKFPQLLGTGGNDGRLEFANNFMQRLTEMLPLHEDEEVLPSTLSNVRHALFGELSSSLQKNLAIGQFYPGAAGKANSGFGFDDESLLNPWDFVFLLEGSLLFAASAARRWESGLSSGMAFPFTVRHTGVGYGSASIADEEKARAEMWLPLWSEPTTIREIGYLFHEGRAKVGRRQARNGLDFVRSVSELGVDRGIDAFQRYTIAERNGLSFFAVPQGRISVKSRPRAALLQQLDPWVNSFLSHARGVDAPKSALAHAKAIQQAMWDMAVRQTSETTIQMIAVLGRVERWLATRTKWLQEKGIRPLPTLSIKWSEAFRPEPGRGFADESTPEIRLAISLASTCHPFDGASKNVRDWMPFRAYLEPVQRSSRQTPQTKHVERCPIWDWNDNRSNQVVWQNNILRVLHGLTFQHARKHNALRSQQSFDEDTTSRCIFASLPDINRMLHGSFDWSTFSDMLWGCSLIHWEALPSSVSRYPASFFALPEEEHALRDPDAFYGLLKLCFPSQLSWARRYHPGSRFGDDEWDVSALPLHARILQLATLADAKRTGEAIVQRLRGYNLRPLVSPFVPISSRMEVGAAALAFPLSSDSMFTLRECLIRPVKQGETDF